MAESVACSDGSAVVEGCHIAVDHAIHHAVSLAIESRKEEEQHAEYSSGYCYPDPFMTHTADHASGYAYKMVV